MSSPSENIRLARIRAGKQPEEVARAAGLNNPTYIFHVEVQDDEFTGNISLRALKAIARTLETTPLEILEGAGAVGASPHRPAAWLADLVKARLDAERLTIDCYGDRIGWNVRSILGDPESLWDFPLVMLQALCDDLGVDWKDFIDGTPSLNAAPLDAKKTP
jgi:transcriptional regulator with XRE-family HTH domain